MRTMAIASEDQRRRERQREKEEELKESEKHEGTGRKKCNNHTRRYQKAPGTGQKKYYYMLQSMRLVKRYQHKYSEYCRSLPVCVWNMDEMRIMVHLLPDRFSIFMERTRSNGEPLPNSQAYKKYIKPKTVCNIFHDIFSISISCVSIVSQSDNICYNMDVYVYTYSILVWFWFLYFSVGFGVFPSFKLWVLQTILHYIQNIQYSILIHMDNKDLLIILYLFSVWHCSQTLHSYSIYIHSNCRNAQH